MKSTNQNLKHECDLIPPIQATKKLVIKVGTQSILSQQGHPSEEIMMNLAQQIATLKQSGHQVVLVSSGAVSTGRRMARKFVDKPFGHSIGESQVLASLGQHELMRLYGELFQKHHILTSQILLTRHDFQTRKHYLNIARLFQEILQHRHIIPIVNENDSVAVDELMFTDNDELAGLIAAQMDADRLIILSNVAGVYTGHPENNNATLISEIFPGENVAQVSTAKSPNGRGGMHSKLKTAKKVARLGITCHIASIQESNVISRILSRESIGTTIHAYKKKSNIKRWIAYNIRHQSGKVYVNDRLFELLKENKHAVSLLPVGIVKFQGMFTKNDLIEIRNLRDELIGIGMARYDHIRLSHYLGQKNRPVLIHYNYLHLTSPNDKDETA